MTQRLICAALLLLLAAPPVSGQRLLEEWRVRASAGPEALTRGAAAVFWNPAQVHVSVGHGEATVLDLRTPTMLGIEGAGIAATYLLDARTTLALGLERVEIGGIDETTTSPESLGEFNVGETRLAAAAARSMGGAATVGAMVQYTRLPDISEDRSVLALGAGLRYRTRLRVPVELALMGATEGDDTFWMLGAEALWERVVPDVTVRGAYGAAGGELAPGITHRLVATAEWRTQVELSLGAASEPDGLDRALVPLAGASVRLGRYRLGAVREQLANDFGAAWSFRLAVGF
ncbi:MAG TPA: hypothetical protein VK928_06595 [Longimicrobiales bacterium]|nr:hypothetical protein [Longimicrobiales bacterium]